MTRSRLPAAVGDDRRYVSFGLHQLVEYAAGAGLGWSGARATGTAQVVVLGAAVLLGLVAAVSDGPLGAGRLLSRRAHRVVDAVLVVAAGVGGVALIVSDHVAPGIVAFVVGALVAYLFLRTRYERRPRRLRPPRVPSTTGPRGAPSTSAARSLGRVAARARAATQVPDDPRDPDAR